MKSRSLTLLPDSKIVDTGVAAQSGDSVIYAASGQIACSGDAYNPDGTGDGISPNSSEWLIPEVSRYVLGEKQANSVFPVGTSRTQTVLVPGNVFLGINVRSSDTCSGSFSVQIDIH